MGQNNLDINHKNYLRRLFLFLAEKIAGLKGLQVASSLLSQGNLTAHQISEQTGLILNEVRHTLFLLENQGLLYSFQKEQEGSNWTTYSWESSLSLVKRVFRQRLKSTIHLLKEYVDAIGDREFLYCANCDTYYSKSEHPNITKCKFCGGDLTNHLPQFPKSIIEELIRTYKEFSTGEFIKS